VAEGGCAAVRLEHRVRGILGVAACDLRQAVQLAVVTVEQLLEGVLVTGDVCRQQLGVASIRSPNVPTSEH
jgi:hypothetical protein